MPPSVVPLSAETTDLHPSVPVSAPSLPLLPLVVPLLNLPLVVQKTSLSLDSKTAAYAPGLLLHFRPHLVLVVLPLMDPENNLRPYPDRLHAQFPPVCSGKSRTEPKH